MLLNIAYSPVVQKYLVERDDLQRYKLSKDVDKQLANTRDLNNGIKGLVLIGEGGNSCGYMDGVNFKEEMVRILDGKSTPYCAGIYNTYSTLGTTPYLVIGVSVYSLEDQDYKQKGKATVLAFVEPKSFGGIESLAKSENASFYLLDRNNRIIVSNGNTSIEEFESISDRYGKESGKRRILSSQGREFTVEIISLTSIGGKMVSIVDEKKLLSELYGIRLWSLAVFLLAFALLAIPFILIINNIVNPLGKLMKFMNEIKSGNLKFMKKRVNLEGYSEIGMMADEFNSMLDEMDQMTHRLLDTTTRLYEMELLRKQTELAFLRSQINPHFLYNTLETIKSIANLNGVYEVRDLAKALAHIFRYSIKEMEKVQFKNELDVAKYYIQIHLIRYKNRFVVEYDFSEEALNAPVIKMILQPIVENAIYHGLEPKLGKGGLYLEGKVEREKELVIRVKDDGVGMEPETLESLRNNLENGVDNLAESRMSSIGLQNVSHRIKLTYGSEYGVDIYSEPEKGTEVVIRLPYRREINV